MRDLGTQVLEEAWRHRGKLLGILCGFILGWIFLAHGALRTLVVLLFLLIGYTLGARHDAGQSPVPEWMSRISMRRRG